MENICIDSKILTNDIKKGMRVKLKNGWFGTMMDNLRGNTRMVEVEGYYTEIGSVYAWDIAMAQMNGVWYYVTLTDKQKKSMSLSQAIFG